MTVTLEIHDGVAGLTLARPPLNLLTIAVMRQIRQHAEQLQESDCRVVVLRAEGVNFSAGADVREHDRDHISQLLTELRTMTMALLRLQVPVLAAVRGACLGGGLELALCADIILAGSSARLGQPEVRLAALAPVAAALLPRRIGWARGAELLLTGRTLTADEAQAWGLVSRTVPEAELDAAVDALARDLASHSRVALTAAKRALLEGREVSLDTALYRAHAIYLEQLAPTQDAEEGIRAFLEKRPPVWSHA